MALDILSETISGKIKAKAAGLGFVKTGICRAVPLDAEFLESWLTDGYHAGMEWMRRTAELRLDPGKYLPGARSIISVAASYYTDDPPRSAGTGQVSRYAVGRDYHTALRGKLLELLAYLRELIPGVEGIAAVDSAPVTDKIWAALSGIGWIGKHSNIITKEYGSYLFLGEIIVTVELAYDKPAADACGTCRACIDACPTGAIVEPYVVDSGRCISYRTIEHRGDFPEEWSGNNEDWVFGCDVCQEVCPWNKFSRETNLTDFLAGERRRFVSLDSEKEITAAEFKDRFRDSPVLRCKHEGYIRNIENVCRCLSGGV